MTRKEYKECLHIEVGKGVKGFLKARLFTSKNAIYMIRKAQYYYKKNRLYNILSKYYINRLIIKYGICVGGGAIIGPGLSIPHPSSIIIGANKIGKNCTIYQQTTIGSAHIGDSVKKLQPEIGDDVTLFAGCKILGHIKVSNGTMVGANAVLLKDTEENSTYVGVPAKRIK